MARKPVSKATPEIKAPETKVTETKVTPARNSPIPKVEPIKSSIPATPAPAAARKEITHDMIAKRAYEISLGGSGDQLGNWLQAERELRGN